MFLLSLASATNQAAIISLAAALDYLCRTSQAPFRPLRPALQAVFIASVLTLSTMVAFVAAVG